MADLLLTTAEAAELLEVHPSTAKRWLDERHGVLRTEGGHRRVELEGVLELARDRDSTTFLEQFHPYESHVWTAIQRAERHREFRPLVSLALGWLLHSDPGRIGRLFEEIAWRDRIPLHAVLDHGLRPLMAEIGEGWRAGRVRVSDEHLVTQLLIDALSRLRMRWDLDRPSVRNAASRPVALVGSAAGNTHHLAALGIRLLLERRGWRVWYLGPDVPADALAQAQRSFGATLVCISLGHPLAAPDVQRCLRELTHMYSKRAPYSLAFGGAMLNDQDVAESPSPFEAFGMFPSAGAFDEWLPSVEAVEDQ